MVDDSCWISSWNPVFGCGSGGDGGEEGGSGGDGGEGSGGELTVSCKIINSSIITIHTMSTMSLMLQNNIVWPSY